jgi:hypothetical protein
MFWDAIHTFKGSVKVKVTLIDIMANIMLQCQHVAYVVAWAFTPLYFGIRTRQHDCTFIKHAPSPFITSDHSTLSLPGVLWPYDIHKTIFIMQDMV